MPVSSTYAPNNVHPFAVANDANEVVYEGTSLGDVIVWWHENGLDTDWFVPTGDDMTELAAQAN